MSSNTQNTTFEPSNSHNIHSHQENSKQNLLGNNIYVDI